ncbi:YibE/F family protein [Actinomarinicola tropica]|uniref:YibE/F family protein n=1 Tax=Actinomarinicola tropica TaxID=2789776 RepID=A0A5Q2RKJ6_9ACTN|nr:YibE/F family protein [Actinomarinicola tropica]QGG94936.1 YibE/F family protein [Actinomarinicola tropica]
MHDHTAHLVPEAERRVARRLVYGVAGVGILALVGLLVLWPRGPAPDPGFSTEGLRYPTAVIQAIEPGSCDTVEAVAPVECDLVTIRIASGEAEGDVATMQVSARDTHIPELEVGDRLIVQHNPMAPDEWAYTYWEHERALPLVALAALFVVAVLALGRWQGARALAGLGLSVGIVLAFLLPALIRGRPALAVALVAATLIAFVALYLAHGVTLETTVALIGTLGSLLLITLLAVTFVHLAHLTGLSGDDAQLLRVSAEALDPAGVLLAGIIIGALGVLDDVTVTQVAAVAEIRAANPALGAAELYRRALRVGRDHIAATVNTLVLAYVGASLSTLLFFARSTRPATQILGQEVVAIEVVRTLVGSIGLVAAVPLTTALAAVIAGRRRSEGDAAAAPSTPDGRPSWEDFAPEA